MKTDFFKPATLTEALSILAQYGDKAAVVNGGTDIVAKITKGDVEPEAIVYIAEIPELKSIEERDEYLSIGGAVTYREIMESTLCQKLSGLIQAVAEVGSPPIRNVATPAGNIANGAPAADCNVILLALDADVVLASKDGERISKLPDILVAPFQTTIAKNELIKEIRIALPHADNSSAYVKLTRRKAQDISRVSVGVFLSIAQGVCREIRIALGAVNKVPVRAYSLEKMLVGKEMEPGLQEIRGVFPAEASPRKSYKKLVTGPVIERASRKAWTTMALGGEYVD
jgi:CO/xanthine dehydrogenase FAD-binding subunit